MNSLLELWLNNLKEAWYNFLWGWDNCFSLYMDWKQLVFKSSQVCDPVRRKVFFTYLGYDWEQAHYIFTELYTIE